MTMELPRKQHATGFFLVLLWSTSCQMTTLLPLVAAGGTAAAASSFPAPLPEYNSRKSQMNSRPNWMEGSYGGGASSDDEGTDEEGMSSEEFEDPPPEENNLSWLPHIAQQNTSSTDEGKASKSKSLLDEKKRDDSVDGKDRPMKTSTKSNSNDNSRAAQNSVTEQDSPPLQTIHKLRRMLDDTDYMTSTPSSRNQQRQAEPGRGAPMNISDRYGADLPTPNVNTLASEQDEEEKAGKEQVEPSPIIAEGVEPLWTSKDRSKYKKVQKRARQMSPPIFLNSDDEASDTDDGLGYVLPNVPVYFSDGEESEDSDYATAEDDIEEKQELSAPPSVVGSNRVDSSTESPIEPPRKDSPPATEISPSPETIVPQQRQQQGGAPPLHVPPSHLYPYPGSDAQSSQQAPMMRPYNPYLYGYPYQTPYQAPYSPYMPPQQQQQYPYANPYPQQWTGSGYGMPPPQQHQYGPALANPMSSPQPKSNTAQALPRQLSLSPATSNIRRDPSAVASSGVKLPSTPYAVETARMDMSNMKYPGTFGGRHDSLAEASSKLSFDAIQKIGLMLVTVALACYAGVSPRTLPLTEYNLKFYENFQLVSLALISPAIKFLSVFDAQENDVNDAVNTFFGAFSLGYPLAFVLEIVVTTLVRLAVFAWFEPSIFSLAPNVPMLVIPWTLREIQYRPKRITLLAADFCASCVASPIIEEYVKLKTLQWTTNLRKNFRWVKRSSASKHSKKRRSRWVAEPMPRLATETDVLTANQFVTQMLAASIGFKLCDAGRRILMYTKATDANKSFYAFCRGLFPIHELSGTLTAIGLAKRDLLGVNVPLWKLLIPGAVIHGMANMRGKKPVFRWGSATPWSEMQLSPLHILDGSTLPQLLSKGFAKLMWLVLLSRVLASCIKQYYYVNRSAKKRTTRYAGNHAAFSAELATAEMLKKK